MKVNREGKDNAEEQIVEIGLRRSGRERRKPKNDCYLVGVNYQSKMNGLNVLEEDTPMRSRRRMRRADDSEDYEDQSRHYRRKRTECNRLQALLEWKNQLCDQLVCVPRSPRKNQPLYSVVSVRTLPESPIFSIAEDVVGLFVNTDWKSKGQTIKDFHRLPLQNTRFMSRGLVFVWAPKDIVDHLLTIMESKGFNYVENFQVINLNYAKALSLVASKPHCKDFLPPPPEPVRSSSTAKTRQQVQTNRTTKSLQKVQSTEQFDKQIVNKIIRLLPTTDPCELLTAEPSKYFNRSKKTMLIFRKISNVSLQLRHQRTCDVLFDMPIDPTEKCSPDLKQYVYNMIETMLPEGMNLEVSKDQKYRFKYMELWADPALPRRAWISVAQN